MNIFERILLLTEKELDELWEWLNKHRHKHHAKSLSAEYYTVSKTGDIIINIKNKNNMAQTIEVLSSQSTLPGQIIPLDASGNPLPISTIVAGSELYTTSDATIATVAPVAGGSEGQFAVTRVAAAGGVVTIGYSATNLSGASITGGGDTITFDAQVAPPATAESLTANYGSAS